MYGDGCFETLKSYSGRFLNFDAHYQRLISALDYLNIHLNLAESDFIDLIQDLLKANDLQYEESMIRFQCWRAGDRGYKTSNTECEWIITAKSISERSTTPVRLVTSRTPVIPTKALNRNAKLSNGLNYIIAAKDAVIRQADDALMLTLDGFISETTVSNIFWGIGNEVFTPSEECDLLPGVTRNLIIDLLKKSEFEIVEGLFTLDSLKSSEYAFTTNSISEISVVDSIDDYKLDVAHPELTRIKSLFETLKIDLLS